MTNEQEEWKELNRQTKMAWYRGCQFGAVMGVVGTLLFGFIIKLIW